MSQKLFDDLIKELDNQPEILDYQFEDGSSIWLAIRFQFRLLELQHKSEEKNQDKQIKKSRAKILSVMLKYILVCWLRKPSYDRKRTDILTLANYEDNPQCPNRMTAAYKEDGQFKVVEWLYSPVFIPFPKIKNTFSFDYFYFGALIYEKVKRLFYRQNINTGIDDLFNLLRVKLINHIPETHINSIKNEVIRSNRLTVSYRESLKKGLKKLNPRLIICSEGNNGDWRHNILFLISKELGIPTAEVQHGTFNLGMNYGHDIVGNEIFKKHKTDYIFTFGEYHCSRTNLPSVCLPLGHYPLEMEKGHLIHHKYLPGDPLNILFVCEGLPPSSKDNMLINVTFEALKKVQKPFNLAVRLHHSESANSKYLPFFSFPGTRYSDFEKESIFKLLVKADIVIMHASTVAFESLYFGKNPFVFEDEITEQYVPRKIGKWFKNAADLAEGINNFNPENDSEPANSNYYWVDGTVLGNFKKFWSSYISKN